MSSASTPAPPRSPKRKRSTSPDSTYHTPISGSGAQTPYPDARNADGPTDLNFAYEDDPAGLTGARTPEELRSSDGDTPRGEDEDEGEEDRRKRRKVVERPRELDYANVMTLKGHKRGVACVRYSPDGKWIASCCKSDSTPGCMLRRQ